MNLLILRKTKRRSYARMIKNSKRFVAQNFPTLNQLEIRSENSAAVFFAFAVKMKLLKDVFDAFHLF